MRVIAAIGSCGAGKSSLLHALPGDIRQVKEGYVAQDEATQYIDNRLYLSKFRYISAWYQTIIGLRNRNYELVVSDRCPYDVAAYVEDQELLLELIKKTMSELESEYKIKIITVLIRADIEIIQRRVKMRLLRETWRQRYHENDQSFIRRTWQFFEDNKEQWDHVIDNSGEFNKTVDNMNEIIGA